MRRALLAALAGGTLLAGAGCGPDQSTKVEPVPASVAPSETLSPLPDYSADTERICTGLQSVYTADLSAIGTQIGRMISYKEAKQTKQAGVAESAAATELRAAATKIRTATANAQDPAFRAAGAATAAKLEASAKDRKYFDQLHSIADLNRTIEPQIADWLNPFAGFCQPTATTPPPSGSAAPSGSPSGTTSAPASPPTPSPSKTTGIKAVTPRTT